MKKIKILFVCTGNICRSPLAHKFFEKIAEEKNLSDLFEVDSCGTGAWHTGANADSRMRKLAQQKGWVLEKRARAITEEDMSYFDYILVMDHGHIHQLKSMFRKHLGLSKVELFRNYDPEKEENQINEVPDPYFDGSQGFTIVYDMVERTCYNLLNVLSKT